MQSDYNEYGFHRLAELLIEGELEDFTIKFVGTLMRLIEEQTNTFTKDDSSLMICSNAISMNVSNL